MVPLDFDEIMVKNGRHHSRRGVCDSPRIHRGWPSIDPWVRKRILGGKSISAADYIDDRDGARDGSFNDWMRDRDALLSRRCRSPRSALSDVDEAATPLATWTRAVNYLGACALSLPAGLSADRLPIGVQFIGGQFAEATLIPSAAPCNSATPWHLQRPVV